ncbi:hypothetical protein HMSSN139_65960 [Paenibacillus sp. HMSSN-139]|nr:hypothetical protein HMSSN139_65960 [Paenibacillus sp. HMSSN-139]
MNSIGKLIILEIILTLLSSRDRLAAINPIAVKQAEPTSRVKAIISKLGRLRPTPSSSTPTARIHALTIRVRTVRDPVIARMNLAVGNGVARSNL